MNRNEHSVNDKLHCKHCGAELAEDSVFCEQCGKRVKPNKWLFVFIATALLLGVGGLWYYLSHHVGKPQPEPKPTYTISVKSSDEAMGTINGGGTYDTIITVTIEALANEGYRFVTWNDGNKERQRNVITDCNQEYVAQFEKTPETPEAPTPLKVTTIPKFLITVESSDPYMGTVKGEGTYDSLAPVTIEAIANNGYRFVSWDDGNTQRKRTFKVTNNQKYVARFVENLTVKPHPGPGEIEVDWNGVATYRGPGLGNKPDGIGGKLVFYKDYQLDLKKIDGRKLDIKAGEIIEPTKFKDGKLNIIGIGTLHRKDGTTHPIM